MNKKILLGEALLALTIVLGFKLNQQQKISLGQISRQEVYKNKTIFHCSPDWNLLDADSLGNTMKPLPGWGSYRWNIDTRSDSARFYFNQGINMYYAFHIIESMASFKKAQGFDASNPMLYWAEALAYGPNINDIEYAATPNALMAAKKAMALATPVTAKEKALIEAMQLRYSADSTISRISLNAAYAQQMKAAYNKFSADADIAALYADALMLQHPWQYWKHNGSPYSWTPEILSVLEKNLKLHPLHPGANHYYIHAVEASPNPGRALASADRLSKMMPSVSHMVHMPSHIYIRTGNYRQGEAVNAKSVNGYNQYLALYPDVVNNAPLYLIHNLHMKTACAMMLPNYEEAKKEAAACVASFDTAFLSLPQPTGNFVQYVYVIPQLVNVRYGKWKKQLSTAAIPAGYGFARVLQLWANGLAYANTGKINEAKSALTQMQQAMKREDLQVVLNPFNAPISTCKLVEQILQGTIAEKEKNLEDAISHFTAAVQFEDALIYNEPRDWLIPSRHYLAHAYLLQKNYTKAWMILEQDLKQNPRNFYALSGLEQIERLGGSRTAKYAAILKASYIHSDMPRPALLY